ncbi:hypothetical protein [uncultured Caulobacter sp.]|uniref:hypothetical protein n=1 Tax=uncultured Caulobacter sp. TaxID=158749 RepID=UPI0026346D30|nr:hypothetical protein [uncultured Caulobacter sp.]
MRGLARSLTLAAILAAAASASAAPRERLSGEAELAQRLEGRVAGKPVACVSLSDIQGSEIIEGVAIVYHLPGNQLLVNRPRGGASSLREDDVLLTKTYGNQLCAPETVQLLDSISHFPRGFVSLGPFVPYSKVKR